MKILERIDKKNQIQDIKEKEIELIPFSLKDLDKDLDFQKKVDEREKILIE